MKQKAFLPFLLLLSCAEFATAQFIVKDVYFETTGVSNQGVVAGYETWAGPYSLWNPSSGPFGTVISIGGLAPGQGVGGQARFSEDGNFLSGTSHGLNGPEMSRYDRITSQWTPIGSLGFAVDSTVSGGYGISGDGNTVVGNSWADTSGGHAFTHAVAWNATEGFLDLGSLHSNIYASARANAVSHDGSVVVGWQDFNGPWKSAVWRKNPAGGYFPNEYLLADTTGSATDEFNQLGECSAVSSDGNWIGGHGDFANNNEPWLWSASTGLISLGTLSPGAQGYVSGINSNGTVAVGRFQLGPFAAELPFIWTPSGGLQNLNTYVNNTLGYSTGSRLIYSATNLSEDGRYIAGYGVDTTTFQYFTYRLSLPPTTALDDDPAHAFVGIFPNPSAETVTVQNQGQATLKVVNQAGALIHESTIHNAHTLDIRSYPAGTYYLSLQPRNSNRVQSAKVVKQ